MAEGDDARGLFVGFAARRVERIGSEVEVHAVCRSEGGSIATAARKKI
jgi:hypothetical protein